jgi:eukaryotic-like serine/threonine-protein kinase
MQILGGGQADIFCRELEKEVTVIGTKVLHYEILEKLGEGGMGVVYKAEDTKLDRLVALKFLPSHLNASEQDKARFIQEAKAAAALNHPNICIVHGVEQHEEKIFIVMECVEGETIRKRVPIAKIDDAIGTAIQIGEALHEAHAKGIVHRDIKADNIMITPKGHVKVMDFGLAKMKGSLKLTRTSSTVGTLAYMAPEQLQGGMVDARSDIFSFGVLLFEMLSGKTPFRGEHEASMVYSIVNEEPEPITKYVPDISPLIANILEKALEKNPDDRYQSVGEMVVDMRRSRKDSTKVTRTHSAIAHTAAPQPPLTAPLPPAQRGKMVYVTGAVLVTVALIAFGIFRFLESRDDEARFTHLKISRLTSDGKAVDVAISPDGKYIAYVRSEKEKQSLFLRQVSTTGNVAISPPTDDMFTALTFSPNGDFLYYVLLKPGSSRSDLYQVPVLGGSPRLIKQNVRSRIVFASDGQHIIYLRDSSMVSTLLVQASLTGGDETVLTRKHSPEHFDDVSISPDGRSLALIEGKSGSYLNHRVVIYSLADREESLLPNQSWLTVSSIDWTADGKGILLTAADQQSSFDSPQIWFLPFPEGIPQRITNDLNNYFKVTPSTRSNLLAALEVESYSNLWVSSPIASFSPKQVTEGTKNQDGMKGIRWLKDGRIVYTTRTSGYDNLWVSGETGDGAKQITSGPFTDMDPAILPDDRTVIFVSNRSGVFNLWRCNIDGSNLRQLTHGNYDIEPCITPDGQWIVYGSFGDNSLALWKVTPSGDSAQLLVNKQVLWAAPSPDGNRLAYGYYDAEQKQKLAVIAFPTLAVLNEFEFSHYGKGWTPDGTSIVYVDTKEGVSNVWGQNVDGGQPAQHTDYASGIIYDFDWQADGKKLVVARGESSTDVVLFTDSDIAPH